MRDNDTPNYPVFWGADRRTAIRPEYILSLQTLATDLYWFGDNVHTDIKRKVKAYELGAKANRTKDEPPRVCREAVSLSHAALHDKY